MPSVAIFESGGPNNSGPCLGNSNGRLLYHILYCAAPQGCLKSAASECGSPCSGQVLILE